MSRPEAPARPSPIFILGADHSGTTLIYNFMAQSPDVAFFNEFSPMPGEEGSRLRQSVRQVLNRAVRRGIGLDWRKKHEPGKVLSRFAPIEGRVFWRDLLPEVSFWSPGLERLDALPFERAERIRARIALETRLQNRRVFLAKFPPLSKSAGFLAEIFPTARFILVVRDGKAVTASKVKKRLGRGRDRSEAVDVSVSRWLDVNEAVERAFAAMPADRHMTIRYEDYVEDIHGAVAALCRFSGIAPPRRLDRLPTSLTVTNEARYDVLTEAEKTRVNERLAPMLAAYGYKPF